MMEDRFRDVNKACWMFLLRTNPDLKAANDRRATNKLERWIKKIRKQQESKQ